MNIEYITLDIAMLIIMLTFSTCPNYAHSYTKSKINFYKKRNSFQYVKHSKMKIYAIETYALLKLWDIV